MRRSRLRAAGRPRSPITIYGIRSPVRVGPRRRRLLRRRRRLFRHHGHHGALKGLLAVLKAKRAKGAKLHRGGHLLRGHRHLRKIRLHRLRHHVHARYRIKPLPKVRYRVVRTRVYRQPKPPNELKDLIAAIKGGFKP